MWSGLLNDAVSSLDCTAMDDKMTAELDRIWKEVVVP
jgi:hypothetical protein